MSDRPELRALADYVGILPAYIDIGGIERVTSDSVCVSMLATMGLDASSEASAAQALADLQREDRESLIDPVRVVQSNSTDVIDFAKKLLAFQSKVAGLQEEWEELENARDAATPEVQQIVSKRFFGRRKSGDITSMSEADGYIEIPAHVDALEPGAVVEVHPF